MFNSEFLSHTHTSQSSLLIPRMLFILKSWHKCIHVDSSIRGWITADVSTCYTMSFTHLIFLSQQSKDTVSMANKDTLYEND